MRKMKKILSVLALTLAVTMMLSTAVFAEDTNNSEDYVVTYSAEEITDIDELIELALEQKAAQPAMFSMEEEDTLVATQVIEIREYADGSVEKDMVATAIIPSKELAIELFADRVDVYSVSNSWSVSGYTVSGAFHFTRRASGSKDVYRFDKIVATIVKTSNVSTTVASGYSLYSIYDSNAGRYYEESQNINFNNSASTGGQSFTLYSRHSGFYDSYNEFSAAVSFGISGQTKVNFSNGQYIDLDYYTAL